MDRDEGWAVHTRPSSASRDHTTGKRDVSCSLLLAWHCGTVCGGTQILLIILPMSPHPSPETATEPDERGG